MHFNGKFFDGKHSASKSCVLACDGKSSLSLLYDEHAIILQNVSWKQTSTNLLITSESFDKYGHIVIANADDQPALLKLLRNIKKPKSIWYSHSFLVYYGIISLLVTLWMFMDSLIFLFPTSIEPWLEKQAKAIHFRNAKVIASASTDATLKKIQDAFAAIDPALQGIEITIVKENSINAVTLPNKKVVIHSKLIASVDSIEELMGILAHEMTHVKCRHCIAAYVKLSLVDMVDKIILGGAASGTGMLMHFLQFSRAAEMQADEGAIAYLEQLGLSTEGMSNFFKKMANKKESKYFSFNFLSTHPSSHDRKQLFEKHKKIYKKSEFSNEDLKKIKKSMQATFGFEVIRGLTYY
jgi:Zn-dependent protease with chaperone function